MIEFLA